MCVGAQTCLRLTATHSGARQSHLLKVYLDVAVRTEANRLGSLHRLLHRYSHSLLTQSLNHLRATAFIWLMLDWRGGY